MKKVYIPFLLTAAFAASNCGRSDDETTVGKKQNTKNDGSDPSTTDETAASSAELSLDEDLAADSISAQVDEAIAAAMEEEASPVQVSGGFLLSKDENSSKKAEKKTDKKKKLARFRECVEEGATAKVSIKKSANRSWGFERTKRKGEFDFANLLEVSRIWSKEGSEVKCTSDKKKVDLDQKNMQGVQLQASFKREKSRNATFASNTKNGANVARSMKMSVEGNRLIKWTSAVVENDNIRLTKSVSQSIQRNVQILNKKGEKKLLEQSLATDQAAPLLIEVEKKLANQEILSRTIVSGKKIATGKDGGRIETSFDKVRYEPGKGCYAVSGTITGGIFAKDEAQPSLTFTIQFDSDDDTITYSNGAQSDYVADGCDIDTDDLELDGTTVEELSKANDVQ